METDRGLRKTGGKAVSSPLKIQAKRASTWLVMRAFTSCTLVKGGTIAPCDKPAGGDWPPYRMRALRPPDPCRSPGSCAYAYDAPYRGHGPNRRVWQPP